MQKPLQTPLVKQEWVLPSGGLGRGLEPAEQPPPKQHKGFLIEGDHVSCCPHSLAEVLPRVGFNYFSHNCHTDGLDDLLLLTKGNTIARSKVQLYEKAACYVGPWTARL